MKRLEQHIIRLLWLVAIFPVLGTATANNLLDSHDKVQVVYTFQQENQEKPFIFDEITVGDASQTVSPQEYFGLGQLGIFSSNRSVSFAGVSCLYSASCYLQDKREFIYLYLFPFHFFW